MKIVFNDKNKTIKDYDISFDGVLATITTDDAPILDGFTTYGLYDVPIVDGSKYTTLYRQMKGKYQLSNDGSIYIPPEPPEPPKPPVPVHSTLEVNGIAYDVTDFDGSTFVIEKEIWECVELFSSLDTFKVNGVLYEHMEYISSIYVDETHTKVTFRQKTDIEVRLDETEEQVTNLEVAVVDVYEKTDETMSTNQEQITNLELAVVDLYEMIGGI